jgi:hypothetical protein
MELLNARPLSRRTRFGRVGVRISRRISTAMAEEVLHDAQQLKDD